MEFDPRMVGKISKVKKLFKSFNLDLSPETAERYTKVLIGLTQEKENLEDITRGIFEEEYEGMVVEKDIPVYSYCEYHVLPWLGQVHIGYIAHNQVLGLSKFTRIVNLYSAGCTLQEQVTSEIATFFTRYISKDVIIMIEALHTCKVARGVQNPFARSITIDARGLFMEATGPRLEFFNSINSTKRST